ncbi:hypothetical protein BIFDEN_01770 [Bifidobacterium dentium ATCC 27678]|nr:hypothetical protein BIFDEN_01770 [Bifidobacterium dentium ATCC 27678]
MRSMMGRDGRSLLPEPHSCRSSNLDFFRPTIGRSVAQEGGFSNPVYC